MGSADRPTKWPVAINTRVTEQMRDLLDTYAAACEVDRSDLVRQAVAEYLTRAGLPATTDGA